MATMITFHQAVVLLGLLFKYVHATAHPEIQWVDCHMHVPQTLKSSFPEANVSVLPPTLHCGHLTVPMDYARPIGEHNNITINLAMYRPEEPKGVIFYCAGGTDPGAVLAWQAALSLNTDFTPNFDGLLDYDLMMVDIRGTWESNPLNVSLELVAPLLGPFPTNEKQFQAFAAAARLSFESWEKHSSPASILQFAGTKEVLQDYESIREALGYERINFLGCSYGSYRAAGYAAKYPCRVNNFALDADIPTQARLDLKAVNRGLMRADAICQNNASCPFHKDGKGSVPKAFDTILDRAANGTLHSFATKKPSCTRTIDPHTVQAAVAGALISQPVFPMILYLFAAAVSGDGEGFVSQPASPAAELSEFWALPLLCSDYHVEHKTFAGFKQAFNFAEKIDHFDVAQSAALQVQLICSSFLYPPPPNKGLELDAKMLLVTADFDVYAPTEKTTWVWHRAPNSGLVVRHGDDHVSFQLPYEASTNITKEFLRTGVLPRTRNDTFVTVYEPGQKREPPVADPYEVPNRICGRGYGHYLIVLEVLYYNINHMVEEE